VGKRIAMLAYTHYATDARPRRAAEALVARGDAVEFVALAEPGAPDRERIRGVELSRLPSRKYRGASPARYLRSYAEFFLRAAAWVTSRHLRRRYDVVYVHTMPDLLAFAGLASRLAGARLVLDVHDTMPELYQSKFGLAADHPLVRALVVQEQLSCRIADAVICVNEPHGELLVARGVERSLLSVVPNLPDPAIFGEVASGGPVADAPLRLVYHGTVAERLGLDVALRGVAQVVSDHPNLRFDIYGRGDFGGRVLELIAELGLDGHVQFTNEMFRVDAVPDLLAGAAAGIVPNREDAATRVMLPVKLLEYAHLGIPVVAARLPTIEHYFSDAAVAYFRPGDAGNLASALRQVLGSPRRRHELATAASLVMRDHAWSRIKHELYAAVDGETVRN
jgi:glycosyltransferase involved in cell wall biosynthesis